MAREKNLLIITPYFAPQTHAAVFRAYKLAKGLPAHGWNVHVLTTDINYMYNEDPQLIPALPNEVRIWRAHYVEPTLRGLRMALGGRDRTFKAIKQKTGAATQTLEGRGSESSNILKTMYNRWHTHWNSVPDVYWTWRQRATEYATKIVREQDISVIMTSSLPFTTLEIGHRVQKATGVKWVADFRDPLLYSADYSKLPRIYKRQKQALDLAADHADHITTLSSAHPLILFDQYPDIDPDKVSFIPTGLDEALIPKSITNKKNQIIFVGEYRKEYGDEFFRVYARAARELDPAPKLLIVGREEINKSRLSPLIAELKLSSFVEFIDHIPQQELYTMIKESSAAALCTSRHAMWWTCFAKMVDYIALKKPVLAIIPDPSEARKWLTQSQLGVFLDGNMDQQVSRFKRFFEVGLANEPKTEICNYFLASHQVKSFDTLFTKLIAQ